MTATSDKNISFAEYDKRNKDLEIESEKEIWRLQITVIPIIIEPLGTIQNVKTKTLIRGFKISVY